LTGAAASAPAASAALYNAAIVAEAKAGAHAGRLERADVAVLCDNPLCGDRVALELEVREGAIAAVGQVTRGCLLTRAAASLLARHLGRRPLADAAILPDAAAAVLAGGAPPADWPELAMFAPVADVASRHDCVLLPFRALARALDELGRRTP
jgi:nitrogen fixation NifU-like protein